MNDFRLSVALAPRVCALLALFCLTLAVGSPVRAQTNVAPHDKNLLYFGRWDRSDPAISHGDWIGSYVRVDFTGTSVGINLGGHSGLDVIIDGEPTRAVIGGPGLVALNPAPLPPGRHTLLVGVKGGGGWDFKGLVLDPGAATRPPVRRPIIEAVGDSITSGSPGPIEAAGNYTWLTAEALGCDHTQISWPGRALTTGYGCADDKRGLDTQYFHRKCFYDSGPDAPWDYLHRHAADRGDQSGPERRLRRGDGSDVSGELHEFPEKHPGETAQGADRRAASVRGRLCFFHPAGRCGPKCSRRQPRPLH